MTKAQVRTLISNKVKGIGKQNESMTHMNRKKDINFFAACLEPFLNTQKPGGVQIQFGRGMSKEVRSCAIYIFCSCVDTAEGLVQCGTYFGLQKCRICHADCSRIGMGTPCVDRDPVRMISAQKKGLQAFYKTINRNRTRLNNSQKLQLETNVAESVVNMIIPLHNHFISQYQDFPAMNLFQ
jgi:hypothetical protein